MFALPPLLCAYVMLMAPFGEICSELLEHPSSPFNQTRVRSLATLVSDSLTDSCLVNLIDVTLAWKMSTQNLLRLLIIVDDVEAEDHVGNSLLQI